MTTTTAPDSKTIDRPARAWRAWFRAKECPGDHWHVDYDGKFLLPGTLIAADGTEANKDVAEQRALDAVARVPNGLGRYWEMVGAFPEGQRPPE